MTKRQPAGRAGARPRGFALLADVDREAMMGGHEANHAQVAHAEDQTAARRAVMGRGALAEELGLEVSLCGKI
ncbi:MAG: hypothetical protein CL813_08855 [Confluentimicrobium sp.]|nr:hypothetical protein [Actibacterium sp.]MBF53041.1 hypothetical protein [Actibacterium sp.]|tara:strand:- start:1184 stop:1402 length:219 start_codon:yes stop_codon:yes gene_type:complete